jgi:hypothetical protein
MLLFQSQTSVATTHAISRMASGSQRPRAVADIRFAGCGGSLPLVIDDFHITAFNTGLALGSFVLKACHFAHSAGA